MRREAVTKLDVSDVDFQNQSVHAVEKGNRQHKYGISKEGLEEQ